MRTVLRIFLQDLRHATGNVVAAVVCVGLVVVPSLYAWFNIAGSWDPYANTGNLQVAVANTDEGFSSDLLPVSVNVGERVCSALRANHAIGWVITDQDEALEGVRSGRYYAAIVIPQDFSRDLLGGLDAESPRPTLLFYENQKENAIANVVTAKASEALREQVDTVFAQTVSGVGAHLLASAADASDTDGLASLGARVAQKGAAQAQALRQDAQQVRAYAGLAGSLRTLLEGGLSGTGADGAGEKGAASQGSAGQASGASSAEGQGSGSATAALRSASQAAGQAADGLDSVDQAVGQALDQGSSALADLQGSLDGAFDDGSATAGQVADQLDAASGTASQRADAARRAAQGLGDLSDALAQQREQAAQGGASAQALEALDKAVTAVDQAQADLESTAGTLDGVAQDLATAAEGLRQGTTDLAQAREQVASAVQAAKDQLAQARSDYQGELGDALGSLGDGLGKAADDADVLDQDLAQTLRALDQAEGSAAGDLASLQTGLEGCASQLDAAADKLEATSSQLQGAVDAQDLSRVRSLLGAGPDALAQFLSAPVELERTAVYPIQNNGSAMAPFYTTLALWVGAIVLVVMLRVEPGPEELASVGGAALWQQYLGRLGVFLVLGLLQATLVCVGDLVFLQIQCEHPLLMLLACWACSLVDVNIMYALVVWAGDVGKAIAVILLVLQVAGSGGSFPPEMLPAAFRAVYPFMPFVPAIQCMRGAVAGVYGLDYLRSMASLLAFVAPALLLGLVLRRPAVRLNHWVEHQLERTRVM